MGYASLHPRYQGSPATFAIGLIDGARQLNRGRRILFYPKVPRAGSGYLITRVVLRNGYQTVTHPDEPFDLAVKWLDQTFSPNDDTLLSLIADGFVLNGGCVDNSKTTVERLHREVFGYGLAVDPTTWKGRCVRKPDLNGAGSGSLIDCPIEAPEPGYIYQRFVDALDEDGNLEEIRITIVGDRIPVVRVRAKPLDPAKIKEKHVKIVVRDATDVFTPEEIALIVRLAHRIGVQFGELDVLRDRHDGRIYVVDVNNTPWGARRDLPVDTWLEIVGRISDAFDDAFFDRERGALDPRPASKTLKHAGSLSVPVDPETGPGASSSFELPPVPPSSTH